MQHFVKGSRIFIIFTVMTLILVIYTAAMYKMQIYDSNGIDRDLPADTVRSYETITATRGNLLDRNGELLVSSIPSYSLGLNRSDIMAAENPNKTILDIIQTVTDYGCEYTDTFPVTVAAPFAYVDMTDIQRSRFDTYREYFGLEENITPSDLIVWLKDHYKIDFTSSLSDTRKIIGIRYELECRIIMNIDDYVFVEKADQELISILNEKGYPGIEMNTGYSLEYHTTYAAHLLGYIGQMDAEDYEYYKTLDYPMNAYIGKAGVESAFEEYLHGVDGYKTIIKTKDGTVVSENVTKEAQPGNNVRLSLDIGLQKVAEDSLNDRIAVLNEEREEDEKIPGAAVVVTEVKSGELLVSASYPTYDPATMRQNYSLLQNAENSPLLNRATQGFFNPGSTFKMVTALAGLRTGTIDRYTTIDDTGIYDRYEGYQPRCWVYSETGMGHGPLDLVGAIQNSCNYFFFWTGDHTGIDAITQAAADFGLGQKTGLEIYEESGHSSTPEYKRENLKEDWYAADTLLASIGQGHNMFTPVQLANYVATIARGGTRYELSLLHSVVSSDYRTVIKEHKPVIANTMDSDKEYISYLQEGMRAVATSGSASEIFGNYSIPIAAKTGTTQSDTSSNNNGVFVCYAPADDPEIAIAVVISKGTSGSTVMTVAADIIDSYFGENNEVDASIEYVGTLIR